MDKSPLIKFVYLIHGQIGTGKTQVAAKLCPHVLELDRSDCKLFHPTNPEFSQVFKNIKVLSKGTTPFAIVCNKGDIKTFSEFILENGKNFVFIIETQGILK